MITVGDRVRIVVDVLSDSGTVYPAGEPATVVGFRGPDHAVVVFHSTDESALVPVRDLLLR